MTARMDVICLVILVMFIQGVDSRVAPRSAIWQDCSDASSPLTITNLNIEPNPISLPGDILFTMEGYSNRTLGSSTLQLDIVREGNWFNIHIPCLGNIGSCTYSDMCTMLSDMVYEDWFGMTRTFGQAIQEMLTNNGMSPGLCPQPPHTMSIIRNSIRLPSMAPALFWFVEGTYQANIRVTDNTSGEELVCFDLRIEIKQNEDVCTGFWRCLF